MSRSKPKKNVSTLDDPRRLLDSAFEDMRAGRLASAKAAADRLLKRYPDHPDVCNLAGLVALEEGDAQAAADHWRRAIRAQPAEAVFHCNLSQAWRALNEPEKAKACLLEALRLRPDYPVAALNLGSLNFAQGEYAEALAAFERAAESAPRPALPVAYRADALRELGRIRAAIAAYEEALALEPNLAHAVGNLGLTLLSVGQTERALELTRRAAELAPDSGPAQMDLGSALHQLGRLEDAMEAYALAFERMPDSARLCTLIGSVWQETEQWAQAEAWYEKALALEPERLDARCNLAGTLCDAGGAEQAIGMYRDILGRRPDCFEASLGLGEALWADGDAAGAIAAMREAAALRPENAHVLARLASVLASAGDVEEANASNRAALAVNPGCIPALANLAQNLRGELPEEDARTMEGLLAKTWPRPGARATLHFGLAHYRDGRKDYRAAGRHAEIANALYAEHKRERGWLYEPEEYARYADRLIETCTPEFFRRVQGMGSASAVPVFIVGMPRSGTTLVEQILASHPRVFGVGERNFASRAFNGLPAALGRSADPFACLAEIEAETVRALADWHLGQLSALAEKAGADGIVRIVDKMPDNYNLLGWLAAAFPKAKIIHCRRDVRDIAVSCWMTQFKEIRWAFDLRHIARRIVQYRRIMAHWRQTLPMPMLEIDYEETVRNQAAQTAKLLEFLELPWDDACLAFHKTERLVRTASVTQVRQPLYTGSLERWRRYEPFLGELLEIVG